MFLRRLSSDLVMFCVSAPALCSYIQNYQSASLGAPMLHLDKRSHNVRHGEDNRVVIRDSDSQNLRFVVIILVTLSLEGIATRSRGGERLRKRSSTHPHHDYMPQ